MKSIQKQIFNMKSISMITTLEKKITDWKSEYRIDGNSLAFYRIFFCVIFGIFFLPSYAWIGEVPKAFFTPPMLSIASLFSSFPDKSFFLFLDVAICASLVLVALGFFTRVSTGALLLAMLVGNNFQYSFGKIDHSILVLCVLLVMLVVNWGQSLSIDQILFKRRPRNDSSIWLLGLLVAFGFFTAGFGKAIVWIDFDFNTNGFLTWLNSGYYNFNRQELLAPAAVALRPLWIWEFADIAAVVFELGFIIAMLRRRFVMTWLMIACFFHLTNCLVLNIPFTPYTICYLAFIPWSKLIPKLETLSRLPSWSWVAIGITMTLIALPFDLFSILNSPSWRLERGIVLWTFTAAIFATTLWKTRFTQTDDAHGETQVISTIQIPRRLAS